MRKVTLLLLAGAILVAFALVALPETIWRLRMATAQPDPRKAQLVTEDIPRFWRAYDLAARDTAHAVQHLPVRHSPPVTAQRMRFGRVGGQMRRQPPPEHVGNAEFLNRSHNAKRQLLLPRSDSLQEWFGKGGHQQPSGFLLPDGTDKMDKKSKKR